MKRNSVCVEDVGFPL